LPDHSQLQELRQQKHKEPSVSGLAGFPMAFLLLFPLYTKHLPLWRSPPYRAPTGLDKIVKNITFIFLKPRIELEIIAPAFQKSIVNFFTL
jgi:hypothetical protein